MSITIRKIAKDLQLAVSTVSKALRDSHEISPATKKRVFEYAHKLDYTPNLYASSLKLKKTRNIAVVVPEVADSFFSLAINGIESVAQAKGYHVMVYLTHENREQEQSILYDFRSGRVDGVLISVSGGDASHDHIHDLYARKIPLVFFDRACEGIAAAKVLTDDFASGYNAAKHLIEKGCRKLCFLALSEDLAIIRQRLKGFQQALDDHGLKITEKSVIYCTHDEVQSYGLLHHVLCNEDRPDGIVGSVEKLATLSYTVCNDLHLAIPSSVKVIGFSCLQIAGLLNPSLTTITQPAFAMGEAAALLLFNTLEKNSIDIREQSVTIPSVLFERASTK